MRAPLKTSSVGSHESRTWHLRFGDHGWACIILCERTGCVAVFSDWLSGTYRWNVSRSALGEESLAAFIVRCDSWYLCNKLLHGQHEEVDVDATRTAIRTRIIKQRREKPFEKLDQWDARELWDEAANVEGVGTMSNDMWRFLDGEPWNFIQHRETPAHRVMREEVVPLLQAAIREQVAAPGATP